MQPLYIIIGIVACLATSTGIVLSQSQFGRTARGERLERIRQSPHFKNERFQNEQPTQLMTGDDNRWKSMWKFLFGKKAARLEPLDGEVTVLHTDLKHLPAEGDLYVWFGHSSFLLRLDGKIFLFDPVFYKGSPVSFVNKAFKGTDYYKPSMMPDTIDYLVLSHDHWDHLDCQTVKELQPRVRHAVCPLGVGEDLEYWGYTKEQLIELDWNEQAAPFTCLPTQHFTGRGLWNPKTMPAAWLITTSSRRVFYTGDGGYSDRFTRFGQQYPDIDLAIMENGQYDTRWNQIHTLPSQLGKEIKALHPRRFLTVHHSKFRLANHPWDEPLRNQQQASDSTGIPLITCHIGEIVKL